MADRLPDEAADTLAASAVPAASGLPPRVRHLLSRMRPAVTVTEYAVLLPNGSVHPDRDATDRAGQERRLERYRKSYPDAVLVQRTVSYGEWAEVSP